MTDQTIEATDESRISRRNALKAAAAVGVGAVAWSGPQITAFGATPAYAAACTGFTVNQFVDNRNTNQGNDQGCSPFEYQDDSGIVLPTNYSWNWAPQLCPGAPINFSFPVGITCDVDIYLYESQGQAGSFKPDGYYALHTFTGVGAGFTFNLPSGGGTAGAPVAAPNNYANTRFAVRVQCIKTSQKDCLNLV